ncbi:hypothetical protein FPRO04_11334 [Fusarium proliferatum]|nr:hypothetical protein FPRO04_11334 [Fusarium proliferatum]
MSSRNADKGETATDFVNSSKPQKLNSKSIPYLSPPNSPPHTPGTFGDETRSARAISLSLLSPPTSPPQQSSALVIHEKRPTDGTANTTTLRTRLGLDNKRCGALTKSKRPCGNWSPAANRAEVTSQLKLMTNYTQSSMELEAALDKLAKFVHCKYHDSGLPQKDRIEGWIKNFPAGEVVVTDPSVLVEKRIRRALVLESVQCIAAVDSADSRCKNRIGGQRVSHCALTIDKIVNPDVYLNHSSLDGFLKVLETNMYCCQHINRKALQKVAQWKSSIVEILEDHLVKFAESSVLKDTQGLSIALNTQRPPRSPSASRSNGFVLRSGSLSIPNFDRDLSTYWPATYDTSPFTIIERSRKLADYDSLYDISKRKLDAMDQKDGYVYMYEVEGNPGFVKIGYTTRSIEERLREWEFDCNRVPKVLFPIPSSTATIIPNASRVEALCHAELEHRRIRVDCHCCLKQHLEWFETPSTEAITVIEKWSNWMATRPYQSIQLRHKVKWTITDEGRKRAWDIVSQLKE